jgi:predicted nuclease of predicted toxin-antitoxin system
VLDNDVDARLVGVFVRAGHECWRGAVAGYSESDDDELAVYADNKAAILITHDREFTVRRKRNTIGKHVRLKCSQPDACDVVERQMQTMVEMLSVQGDFVVEVSTNQVTFVPGHWE